MPHIPQHRIEADIAAFTHMAETANIERVDEPTGRKHVEIAWEDENGFHFEEGEAYGAYRTDRTIKIDWTEKPGMTTVMLDDIVDLDDGDYYE